MARVCPETDWVQCATKNDILNLEWDDEHEAPLGAKNHTVSGLSRTASVNTPPSRTSPANGSPASAAPPLLTRSAISLNVNARGAIADRDNFAKGTCTPRRPPRIVAAVESPEGAVGVVDPAKRRVIYCDALQLTRPGFAGMLTRK